jgi:hypothetical protein
VGLLIAACAAAALAMTPAVEAGVAPGPKCAGGPGCSVLPPPAGVYTGSDQAGRVRFVLFRRTPNGGHASPVLTVRDFSFASKCSSAPTRITRAIALGRHYRFTLREGGIALRGSFVRAFVGDLFQTSATGAAQGTVRVRTPRCDSGPLSFEAQSP